MFTLAFISTWVALLILYSIHTWSQMRNKLCNYFKFNDSGPTLKNIADVDVGFMINPETSGKKGNCKGVTKGIDVKSDPFICLALKLTLEKSQLKKSKYTFNFTFYDDVFIILLENNVIRLNDHKVLFSIQNPEGLTSSKWHNSFDHNTSNCNMFDQDPINH
jgi:hypothetical protein